ncbi:MAG: PAS domain-containing protein [Candidatus Margulisiibacteriota bacterium]
MVEISGQELKQFKLLAAAVDQTLDGIAFTDLQANILYVNKAFADLHGYPAADLLGKHVYLFHNDQQKPQVDAAISQVKATGKFSGIVWRVHRNGAVFPSRMSISIFHDPKGLALGIIAVVRDVTEQLRTEAELRGITAKYDAILKAVPNIIMEVDVNKVYTWANEAGKMFFGPEVVGKEAAAYFAGPQSTYQIVDPLFAGSEDVIYVESWQKRHDGEPRLLAWWCRTLKDADGKVAGALSTARDITDQKKAEEALLQAMKELKLVNNAAIGNELKIIEREKEINGLLKELGRGPEYR